MPLLRDLWRDGYLGKALAICLVVMWLAVLVATIESIARAAR